MLKLLRTLPKVLKFLPSDKAKDARSFMMSFQYWLGGSPDNLESMLLMLAKDFVKVPFGSFFLEKASGLWLGPRAEGLSGAP